MEHNIELANIKDKLFEEVVIRLKDFNQDFVFEDDFMFNENYYSPRDFFIELTPREYEIINKWRKEKWLS